MSSRKKTPDILTDILDNNSKTVEQCTGIKEDKSQHDSTPARQHNSKTVYQYTGKDEDKKQKATYYLSPVLLDRLDQAALDLKKLTGSRRISKSRITELALENALDSLDKSEAKSWLTRELRKEV